MSAAVGSLAVSCNNSSFHDGVILTGAAVVGCHGHLNRTHPVAVAPFINSLPQLSTGKLITATSCCFPNYKTMYNLYKRTYMCLHQSYL